MGFVVMPNKDKNRVNVVYSTDPNFQYEYDNANEERETLSPDKQKLKVSLDSKQRKGKEVTLIAGFIGTKEDLEMLGKTLKTYCGIGGSAKDGEIILQGDCREKVKTKLKELGYVVK